MTERTVTITEEVEKTVEVCDWCGLGGGHESLKAYSPGVSEPEERLHFHPPCVEEAFGRDGEATPFVDLEDDYDADHFTPRLLFDRADLAVLAVGITLAALGVIGGVMAESAEQLATALVVILFAIGIVGFIIIIGRRQAAELREAMG